MAAIFFALSQVVFSQMAPQAGGSMGKEESDNREAAEESVDLCFENIDKLENEKNEKMKKQKNKSINMNVKKIDIIRKQRTRWRTTRVVKFIVDIILLQKHHHHPYQKPKLFIRKENTQMTRMMMQKTRKRKKMKKLKTQKKKKMKTKKRLPRMRRMKMMTLISYWCHVQSKRYHWKNILPFRELLWEMVMLFL